MVNKISKVLIIGSGATEITHESETDSATFQVAVQLRQLGIKTILLDNNPFSFSLENKRAIDKSCILPLTLKNVLTVIRDQQPDAILPNLGGLTSLRLTQEIIETGILRDQNIQLLGTPEATIRQINNPVLMNQTLKQMKAPIITTQAVHNFEDALNLTREIGFPVIIKPAAPKFNATKSTCHDVDELADAVSVAIGQSKVGQVIVQQSIAGYKEIEMVVLRDQAGTTMQIATVEDFDPIGIHAGDSIGFTPAQTLLDKEFQQLRNVAFAITRKLRIVGVNHVQFAVNPNTSQYYVIKNSPYFDRITAFAAKATGYPLALVCAHLLAGKHLSQIKLPNLTIDQAALVEPTMDHIAARLPVWPFDVLPDANRPLSTQMRSTGSTMGVGRSIEEALMKAIRAAHFHQDSFAMAHQARLSDDQIVQQLIHPKANRIMVFFEALRRGYSVSELTELTKIDPFYFNKLAHVQQLEGEIAEKPNDADIFQQAKYYGFSNRTIASLWGKSEAEITEYQDSIELKPTFKEIEPSAAEFDQHTNIFYSTYELENESEKFAENKALIIGVGAFRLGSAGADDYQTASILQELKLQHTKTILVNNNPSAVSMNRLLADKIYIEPLETPDIKTIIEIEQPDVIYVPGMRQRLAKELQALGMTIKFLPQNQPILPHMANGPEYAYNAIFDGEKIIELGVSAQILQNDSDFGEPTASAFPVNLDQATDEELKTESKKQLLQLHDPGIFQVLFVKTDRLYFEQIRKLPASESAFFSKVLKINLSRLETKLLTNQLQPADLEELNGQVKQVEEQKQIALSVATFPFTTLHLYGEPLQTASVVGAQMAFGHSFAEAISLLNTTDKNISNNHIVLNHKINL